MIPASARHELVVRINDHFLDIMQQPRFGNLMTLFSSLKYGGTPSEEVIEQIRKYLITGIYDKVSDIKSRHHCFNARRDLPLFSMMADRN